MKKNNFKEDIFNACRVKIIEFIRNHSNAELDTKNMDNRLKKLLSFS